MWREVRGLGGIKIRSHQGIRDGQSLKEDENQAGRVHSSGWSLLAILNPSADCMKPGDPQFRNLQTEKSSKSLNNFLGVCRYSEAHLWCGVRSEV